jgi:hypothetical protein
VGSQLQSLGILDGPLDQFPRARWVNVFKRSVVCQPFDDLRVLARINQMIKHIFDAQTIHIKEKDRQADLTRGVLS